MKRRNADNAAKLRQRIKKSRIGEGVMNWLALLLSIRNRNAKLMQGANDIREATACLGGAHGSRLHLRLSSGVFVADLVARAFYLRLVSLPGTRALYISLAVNTSTSLQAFSVFFVCVTVTSDLLFFLCIPTQLLFLIASTYVWLQYVWHAGE